MLVGAGMFVLCSCTSQGSQQKEVVTDSVSVSQVDPVIETIMSRRSIRKYKPKAVDEGGNLAASKIRNLECPNYEICLIDYGCGKFNRKIHIMEQYP